MRYAALPQLIQLYVHRELFGILILQRLQLVDSVELSAAYKTQHKHTKQKSNTSCAHSLSSLALETGDQPNNLYLASCNNIMAPPSVVTAEEGSSSAAKESSSQIKDDTTSSTCQATITSVKDDTSSACQTPPIISSPNDIQKQITKGVVRAKLSKRRHLVLPAAISPTYLDTLMPEIVTNLFQPQTVKYNGGVANITNWKISCYLEVMDGGIPWKVRVSIVLLCEFVCFI